MSRRKHIGDIRIAPKNSIGDTHPQQTVHPAVVVAYIDPGFGGAGWTDKTSDYRWNFGTVDAPVFSHTLPAGVTVTIDPTKANGHDVELLLANATHDGTATVAIAAYISASGDSYMVTSFTIPDNTWSVLVHDRGPYDAQGNVLGSTAGFTPLANQLPLAYIA